MLITACGDSASPNTGVAPLQLVSPPSSLTLTLRDANGGQEGLTADGGDVRLRTARRPDDDATTRLCGVLVGRSRFSERLPFAWPVDTMLPQLARKIIDGGDVYGARMIVPGVNAAYHFEGFTVDGGTRVSVRWPVRSERSVPASASDPEIESALSPSPATLDSLVMALRFRDPGTRAPWSTTTAAQTTPDSARAVRLVHDVPLLPIGFSVACRDAHFVTDVNAGQDKALRVLVNKGDRLTASVSSAVGTIAVQFATARATSSEGATASVTAADSGFVTLLLRYAATSSADPQRKPVLLRVTSQPR